MTARIQCWNDRFSSANGWSNSTLGYPFCVLGPTGAKHRQEMARTRSAMCMLHVQGAVSIIPTANCTKVVIVVPMSENSSVRLANRILWYLACCHVLPCAQYVPFHVSNLKKKHTWENFNRLTCVSVNGLPQMLIVIGQSQQVKQAQTQTLKKTSHLSDVSESSFPEPKVISFSYLLSLHWRYIVKFRGGLKSHERGRKNETVHAVSADYSQMIHTKT
jgi:hypothetical protein